MLVKKAKYVGVCVCRRPYLLWPRVIVIVLPLQKTEYVEIKTKVNSANNQIKFCPNIRYLTRIFVKYSLMINVVSIVLI